MANMKDLRACVRWVQRRNPLSDRTSRETRVIDFLERDIARRELESATRRMSKITGKSKGECRIAIRDEAGRVE